MEEEKDKDKQSQDQGYSESIKQKVNETKKTTKKIKKIIEFFKKHPLLAHIMFWVVLIIIIIILLVSIIYVVLKDEFDEPKDSINLTKKAMQDVDIEVSTDMGMNDLTPKISCVDSGATIKDGKYLLIYDDYDENEKKRRVEEIKSILKKKNIEIYSNQCLLFLYALRENGLQITKYNKDDLESIYMFYKAEIATSSLDLRSVDEMYKEDEKGKVEYQYPENSIVPQYENSSGENKLGYSKEDYDENDYSDDSVCGTVRLQRITYKDDSNTNTGKINYLTYVPLENFNQMINSNNKTALDHFSIDEENNLLVATWENFESEYTFNIPNGYSGEEQAKIKGLYENKKNLKIDQYRSIPYSDLISKYTLNFDLLMSMLATTENATFGKELAKLSEESYMVITLHEEHSITNTTNTITHTDNELIYGKVNLKYSTRVPAQNGQGEEEKTGYINNFVITNRGGMSGNGNPAEEIDKILPFAETEEGIKSKHLEGLTQYSYKATKQYSVINKMKREKNVYKVEITEVDNWYEYYSKTYSARSIIEIKEEPEEKEEELEITEKNIGKRTIRGHADVSKLPYVKRIGEETHKNLIKNAEKLEEINEYTIEYIQAEETFLSYASEKVNTQIDETKYKKGVKSKEVVQVKIQEDNKLAVLTLATDEVLSKGDDEYEANAEKIYEVTDELTNGFLYVYDKHKDAQDALKSIDNWAYKMIDSMETTERLKYLLFLYDGTDFGVTEYNLNLFRPDEMKGLSHTLLLIKYIRTIRGYMDPPIDYEGKCYVIEEDKNGDFIVGYGINIEKCGYKDRFLASGYKIEAGAKIPIDFVNAIEEEMIENTRKEIKAYTSGLNLKEYQINALVCRVFNSGSYKDLFVVRDGKDFIESYKAYWNQETDDKYPAKDNNANFEHELYTKYMSLPVSSNGVYMPELTERRRSEWILFQTGYYDVLGEWHLSGGRIIECAKYIHEYMEEHKYIYCALGGNGAEECDIMGERHGLNATFEQSKTGFHHSCCSTYVSWVLQDAGYFTEDQHLGPARIYVELFENKGWEKIEDVDLLEAGDVLYYDGHIEIYAGDGMIYNAGCGAAIRGSSPAKKTEGFDKLICGLRAPD